MPSGIGEGEGLRFFIWPDGGVVRKVDFHSEKE